MHNSIFRAYDVRGRYPDELTEEIAHTIGRALAGHWKHGTVIVAHDARLSSPALYTAIIKGLATNSSITIEKIGLATSPMFYFLVNDLRAAGGIMVTASHNPKEYNGLKIVGPEAEVMSGKEVLELLS